ncbi:HMA2 domain-containing protein [Selenomonas sp.]|uniref:HMA2 domain-containing protein n=1 Tax=Selenomonas sp. TaxID=2053611 RepID=UPI0025FA6FE8|nr:hypothetical protein [Selenomonas sp.]MBQ1868756.1 hypothetical protein [Selenomonas sp.]
MPYGFKNLPLGLPMTVASVGTLATLFAGKKFHAGFGVVWAALSLWHGWQHHKKMRADVCRLTGCDRENDAADSLARIAASFQVDSYMPGRVRLRSSMLVANSQWQKPLEDYVKSFTGVKAAAINPLTGSLLITYDPEKLRQKPKLLQLEQQLAKLAAGRI